MRSYQLRFAAISKRQVAVDGHKSVARATELEVLDLDYIARDRRVPSMLSLHLGLLDCVRAVVGVDVGPCFFLGVTCPSDTSPSHERRDVGVGIVSLDGRPALF